MLSSISFFGLLKLNENPYYSSLASYLYFSIFKKTILPSKVLTEQRLFKILIIPIALLQIPLFFKITYSSVKFIVIKSRFSYLAKTGLFY